MSASRWRLLAVSLLGLVLAAASPVLSSSVARLIGLSNGTVLTVGTIADGQVLTRSGTSIVGSSGGGVGGSTGAADNAVLRADGSGGSSVQAASGVTISDAGVIAGATWQGAAIGRAYQGYQPVSSASAPTVNDDSGDGYAVGQVWIETASKTSYILTDATVGAAVWRAVLRGRRVHAYVASGAALAVLQGWSGTSWVNIGTPVAPDATQSDAGATIALSGTGITGATGYAAFDKMSTAWRVWWYLDGTGNLGLTWTPASTGGVVRLAYDGDQPSTTNYQVGAWLGHKTTPATWGIHSAYGKGGASNFYWYTTDDDAVGASGSTCTRANPAEAGFVYDAAPVSIGWGYGRAAAGFVSDSAGGIGASLATPAFGFAAVRPATGGAALTVANMVADLYLPASDLTP